MMHTRPTMACTVAALLVTAGDPVKPDREGFLKQYALAAGQNVKFIAPPFHPYRHPFSQEKMVQVPGHTPLEADVTWYRWDPKKGLSRGGQWYGQISVRICLEDVLGVESFEMEGNQAILEKQVRGYFVVRTGVPPAKLLPEFEKILRTQLRIPARLEFQQVKRLAYVAKGRFHHKPINEPPWDSRTELYVLKLNDDPSEGGGRSGDLKTFMGAIGTYIDSFAVDETTGPPTADLNWHFNGRGRAGSAGAAWVLSHVTEQTGLTFTQEERAVRVLVVQPLK